MNRHILHYRNELVDLKGKWNNTPGFGSLLQFKLKNISDSSLRITRLVFPAENGLDNFLKGFTLKYLSFFRNGYQSWSLARSYKLSEKPLRPWLHLVSLVSSNMANLPSNNPGNLSSEMFTVISDISSNRAFFAGQAPPFNQFLYIRLIVHRRGSKTSHFELVYDFGRKMIRSGEVIELDGIIMASGETTQLLFHYFRYIKSRMRLQIPEKNIKGWCSWYYYYTNIEPKHILENLNIIHIKKIHIDVIQIDDEYQKKVGDWLDLKPQFKHKMKMIADEIHNRGFQPGIWIAPFIAERKSKLVTYHPEYIIRNEYGKPIIGGFNPHWRGRFFYGLDITHPRFEEYIRKVIHTIVHEWGFTYLKLDFMYGGCLRGGTHHDMGLTRAEVLKSGIRIIREEAGKNVVLSGCGMPLSAGIGLVDIMRIGPDTAPCWHKLMGLILRTGAMSGLRNSIRNSITRSEMNRCLWINDPDCVMLRHNKTRLNRHERLTQINAVIITGGLLFISDGLHCYSDANFIELQKAITLSDECVKGRSIVLDIMETGLPEIVYNTAGYLCIFNFKNHYITRSINLHRYSNIMNIRQYVCDAWSDAIVTPDTENLLHIKNMPPHSSRLFRIC